MLLLYHITVSLEISVQQECGGQLVGMGGGHGILSTYQLQKPILPPLSPSSCAYQALILCKAKSRGRVEVGRKKKNQRTITRLLLEGGSSYPSENFSHKLKYLSLVHMLNP